MAQSPDIYFFLRAGIGLAIARELLKQQCRLVVTARSAAALEQLRAEAPERVQVLAGDMTDMTLGARAVELATSQWGALDGLVVNHGTLDPIARIADADVEDWRRAYDVNVLSAVALVKAALPALRASKGRIVLTSSGAAITAYSSWGCYGAGKAAINHLALTLAAEEPEVTSVAIRPGTVDTEMQRDIREKHSTFMDAKDVEKFGALPTNGGLLRPDQPGNVIARLAMDAPKELSGQFLS
ncbi:MAG: SDR family NAD(P)-dependent oxidoreductase [Terriglobus roseus]|nr:SDR family NAD(P)-dependent oxidoreductase [Terriglobus roseus]